MGGMWDQKAWKSVWQSPQTKKKNIEKRIHSQRTTNKKNNAKSVCSKLHLPYIYDSNYKRISCKLHRNEHMRFTNNLVQTRS